LCSNSSQNKDKPLIIQLLFFISSGAETKVLESLSKSMQIKSTYHFDARLGVNWFVTVVPERAVAASGAP
jgi:hypothetical protein